MKLYSGACPKLVLTIAVLFLIKQVKGSLETIQVNWLNYKAECFKMLQKSTIKTGIYCNGTFDQIFCWPNSPPGNISVPCPSYLPWLENGTAGNAYRVCLDDGNWQKDENSTEVWRDYTECDKKNDIPPKVEEHPLYTALLKLYTVGYSFSLATLVLALFILLLLRKLHCTRNYIHMNLFASFILRATGVLIKDGITHNSYLFMLGPQKPKVEEEWISFLKPEKLAVCRIGPVFMHYVVGANYFWLLVEGIYLHRLLVTTVLSEKHLLQRYVLIGWGIPVLFVVPWGIIKYQLENERCWTTIQNMAIWWIIRGPIFFSIAVNFCIFLKLLKLLLSKFKAWQMSFRDYKFRLARSTCLLILLLGIQEIIFTFTPDEQVEGLARHIKQFIQLPINSFHGFLVAYLYCFSNGEVKAELRRQWSHFQLAYPFICIPCSLGEDLKFLGRCQKKLHLSNNCLSLEVIQPQSAQRTDCSVELSPTQRHNPRVSISNSSEGEFTTGVTIEETFEESEI
ncbi:glucagon-like peptide 2 receptor isoform X1 [Hemicordylus capensis]|uniref:glucagon-like peptide 2 receptor isoform X1 n=1 Tax=Hemicordylus capensis TaxID=884348 RepID=UPI00230473FC|nr:glucagon-like peptide 2 receptor isoform X1 [Hemicordylus capensis]